MTYSTDYFAQYKVVTLTDMIRLIPGGVNILNGLDDNQQSRGLGSSGAQILIDGKRMSGKANDMETRLARIQVNQVERIDLIRGNAKGLDVRNQGILINVILKTGEKDTVNYLTEFRITQNNQQHAQPEYLISASGVAGNLEYDIELDHDLFPRVSDFTEDRMDASRQIEQVRLINREFLSTENSVTANVQYTFDNGDILRLNGLFEDVDRDEQNVEEQIDFETKLLAGEELLNVVRDDKTWEIGGDFETQLGNLGKLKTIFVSNKQSISDRIVQEEVNDSEILRLFTFAEESEEMEQVIRTSLSTSISSQQTLDVGAEAAFNELDALQSFDVAPFESSNIKEDRYEIFTTYSFDINKALNVQTALVKEISTIKQDALGIKNERSFNFWKTRIEARYDLDLRNQFW